MTIKFADLVEKTLTKAFLPTSVSQPEQLVEQAICLFADNLNQADTRTLAQTLNLMRLQDHEEKKEHQSEAMLELLAKQTGISPSVADDIYGALYESFWLVLSEDQMQRFIAQVPTTVSRELRAARPGQKRLSF